MSPTAITSQSTISGSSAGENKTAISDPWMRALEKAHFEEQRDAMTSSSEPEGREDSGRGVTSKSGKLRHDTEASSRANGDVTETPEIERIGRFATGAYGKENNISRVADVGVRHRASTRLESLEAPIQQPPVGTKGGVTPTSRGEAENIKARSTYTQFVAVQKTSLSLLQVEEGLELVIRNPDFKREDLLKTIAGIQSLLRENNTRLSSARVNGNIQWQSVSESVERDIPEADAGKIDRTF